jgi:sugar O-acyltransferase (sialic acid O-acetyltransferase NeuD family)
VAPARKRVIVWGAGGHGRVVADVVLASGHDFAGFADRNPGALHHTSMDAAVLSETAFLSDIMRGRLPLEADAVALGIGDNRLREAAMARLAAVDTPAFVHPSAAVSRFATLGLGTVVMAQAVVNSGATVGRAVIINSSAIVEHDCEVADAVHVSPGATLTGAVRIGERAWVGAGAVVLLHRIVGCDAVVGAGAVVTRDVGDGETVVGVPARVIHRVRDV